MLFRSESAEVVSDVVAGGDTVYGVNTGFGQLAEVRISDEELLLLQENLVRSHAVGVGEDLGDSVVRLVLLLKVIALAAGMVDGLEAGSNAKSALLARGLAEIARLGTALGARVDTFFGVAGVGDLATTCFSPFGRNRTCGELLGRGRKLEDVLKQIPGVVEGVPTTQAVVELAERYRAEIASFGEDLGRARDALLDAEATAPWYQPGERIEDFRERL